MSTEPERGITPVSFPFESEAQVREYVEGELDRSVRVTHPDLDIMFRDQYTPSIAKVSAHQWWDIIDRRADPEGFYRLEARLDAAEFVIWFGYLWGGEPVPTPEHLMRPAVHVDFATHGQFFEERVERTLPPRYQRNVGSLEARGKLGAVLEWLFAHREPEQRYPHMRYPMNRSLL